MRFATSKFMDRVRDTSIWGEIAPRVFHGIMRYQRWRARRVLGHGKPPRVVLDAARPRYTINIAQDFSPSPSGRTELDGPMNAHAFLNDLLITALNDAGTHSGVACIILDGVDWISTSWIEEAFGSLQQRGFSRAFLINHMEVIYTNPYYTSLAVTIWQCIPGPEA